MQSRWFLVVLLTTTAKCSSELFRNPDFEDENFLPWFGKARRISLVGGAFSGEKSIKIRARSESRGAVGQVVPLLSDTRYRVGAYIKLTYRRSAALFQTAEIIGSLKFANGTTTDFTYVSRGFIRPSLGWVRLEGTFRTPAEEFVEATIYIQIAEPGVEFLVDATSLKELWKAQADIRIEKYRKTDFRVNIEIYPRFHARDITLEIRHTKHSFPFGTLVSDIHVVDPFFKPYQDLLHVMFNWYTVGTYKWDFNKGTPENPDYSRALRATEILNNQGLPVRAHNMFWGDERFVPQFAKELSKEDLKKAIMTRVEFMANITNGKVKHWDVLNGPAESAYFEETLGDPNFSKKLFSMAHKATPTADHFLNQGDVVADGKLTRAFADLAKEFKAAYVGLDGLGIPGHFRTNRAPDPYVLMARLDKLAEVGVPLWITELDIQAENVTVLTDWYETAWRLFYSHPSVEGILLWDFWSSTHYRPFASLVDGNAYAINEAGQRWLKLLKEEWSTRIYYSASDGLTAKFRGFQGNYEVIVKNKGVPIKLQKFHLGKEPTTFYVSVGGNGEPITVEPLPTVPPVVLDRTFPHRRFTIRPQKLGVSRSRRSSRLVCVSMQSQPSAVGDDAKAKVTCGRGYVMTSCSSFTQDNGILRDGELIEIESGDPVCVAVNGFQSTAPVIAQARCCRLTGMTCEFVKSGPLSFTDSTDGDRAVATCARNRIPTGCSATSFFVNLDGSLHESRACVAQINGFTTEQGAVSSYASCCSAPNLRCEIRTSVEGAQTQGSSVSIKCSSVEAMVGCSAFSEDGRLAGSRITGDQRCEAISGADRFTGERGVVASAVCCR